MSDQVLFSAEYLNLNIGKQTIYQDAQFAINEGERIGLIGRNGSGKSTLIRIITGEELPSSGNITRAKNLRCACLPQDFELDNDRTVKENVRDGLAYFENLIQRFESVSLNSPEHGILEHELMLHDAWNMDSKLDIILDKLDLGDGSQVCHHLSGGEKRRVALARAIISDPDLLLLDEPTNHLDVSTIEWIENFLASYTGSCLFVTHDRYFLDRISTKIVELNNGKFCSYQGSYSDFLEARAEKDYNEDVLENKRKSFLRSEIEWVRRSPKARLKRNMGRVKRFDEISAVNAPVKQSDMELLLPPPPRLGNKTVDLKNVSLAFGDRKIITDFSMEFAPGSKTGIVGPNGIGKSSLIKMITGQLAPDQGKVEIASTVEFNYIDQSRVALDPEETVYEEISQGVDHVKIGADKVTIWSYLKRFLFEDERINTQIKYLSGGEKARLILAKVLKNGGNFFILDEPTNDLDLSTLRILEESLANFGGCIIVVSHDRYFLNRICNKIIAFEGDGVVTSHVGDYDYYLEKRAARQAVRAESAKAAPQAEKPAAAAPTPVKQPVKKLSFNEQREWDNIEKNIESAENKASEIEQTFSDPDFFTKHSNRIAELQQQLDDAKAEVARLYARWEELDNKRNQLAGK